MRRWCLGVALLAGCYRPTTEAPCVVYCNYNAERACPGAQECGPDNLCHAPGGGCGEVDDASPIDVTDGPPVDDPPGSVCFGKGDGTGPGLLRICHPQLPAPGLVNTPQMLNTDTSLLCEVVMQGSTLPGLCVIYAENIAIEGTLRVEGARPLVLVASEGINVDGTIDVAGHIDSMVAAAGADSVACTLPTPPATSAGGGAGGGAGGTAQGTGGTGGSSGTGTQGRPGLLIPLTGVHGGCSGGAGISSSTACKPGFGGGAVYLIAGSGISLTARGHINASGAGALAGGGSGCGAGSGGLIGFDTPSIVRDVNERLMANGGGGSSGFNNNMAADGNDSASPSVGGIGGLNVNGGSGGNGAGGVTLIGSPGTSVATNLNGGGGGGGAGWIVVYGGGMIPGGVNVSPPPSSP